MRKESDELENQTKVSGSDKPKTYNYKVELRFNHKGEDLTYMLNIDTSITSDTRLMSYLNTILDISVDRKIVEKTRIVADNQDSNCKP